MNIKGLMRLLKFNFLVFGWMILLLYASSVFSQESTIVLSLHDCMESALKQGKEFDIAKKKLEASRTNYSAKRLSFYLPKLSLNSNLPSYDVTEDLSYFGGFEQRVFIKDKTLSYYNAVNLSQNFFTGGNLQVDGFVNSYDRRHQTFFESIDTAGDSQIPERRTKEVRTDVSLKFIQPLLFWSSPNRLELDKAKIEYQLADKDYAEKVNSLVSELVSIYFDLLITQKELLIAEKKVKSSEIALENTRKMKEEGIKSEEEYYKVEKENLNNKIELIDKKGKIKELENNFLQKTNLKTKSKIELKENFEEINLSSEDKKLLQMNIDNSAQVLKAKLEVKSKEIALNQEASTGGISGNFEATYGLWGRGDQLRSSWDDLRRNRWGINVSVSIPLWDGGARDASLKSLELSLDEARNQLELTKNTDRLNLEIIANKLDNSNQKNNLLLKENEIYSKKLENNQEKMKSGLISEKELLDTEISYLETRKSYFENLKEFYLQKIELKKLWGVPPEID